MWWSPPTSIRCLAAAALALSCGPAGVEVPDAWQVIDLWQEPATVTGSGPGKLAPKSAVVTLRGRRVMAVQQRAGDRLSWRLELGAEPTLAFRPNAVGGRCDFEVTVRGRGGDPRSVYLGSHLPRELPETEERGDTLGERVDVDLSAFAGRSVELAFSVAEPSRPTCETAQWASPTVASRGGVRRPVPDERPNVILIAADTLRTDALGTWGRTPSVTPNLDRLAAQSDVWLRAFASCNSTNPSFASLMTGLYVKSHGVFNLKTPLPDDMTTLAELLQAEGYATSAVLSVRHLAASSGLRQGFDRFEGPRGQFFAETAVNLAIQQLQDAPEPFFLWLHLFDPHTPQNPPAPFHAGYRPVGTGLGPAGEWTPFRQPGPRAYDALRSEPRLLGHADLYPGEVSYLDWQLGRLLDFLDSRRLLADSLLIFVADHGENLGEHDIYFNHVGLFDTTVHVPLLIRWPGQRQGSEQRALVQHFDVFPTILSFLGIEPPPNDGIDLRQAAHSGRGRRAVFANHANDHGEMVRTESHKYYRNRAPYRARGVEPPAPLLHPRGAYFYDLAADPREQHNLAGSDRQRESSLAAVLDRWLASGRGQRPPALELNAEERAQLEALGYVE